MPHVRGNARGGREVPPAARTVFYRAVRDRVENFGRLGPAGAEVFERGADRRAVRRGGGHFLPLLLKHNLAAAVDAPNPHVLRNHGIEGLLPVRFLHSVVREFLQVCVALLQVVALFVDVAHVAGPRPSHPLFQRAQASPPLCALVHQAHVPLREEFFVGQPPRFPQLRGQLCILVLQLRKAGHVHVPQLGIQVVLERLELLDLELQELVLLLAVLRPAQVPYPPVGPQRLQRPVAEADLVQIRPAARVDQHAEPVQGLLAERAHALAAGVGHVLFVLELGANVGHRLHPVLPLDDQPFFAVVQRIDDLRDACVGLPRRKKLLTLDLLDLALHPELEVANHAIVMRFQLFVFPSPFHCALLHYFRFLVQASADSFHVHHSFVVCFVLLELLEVAVRHFVLSFHHFLEVLLFFEQLLYPVLQPLDVLLAVEFFLDHPLVLFRQPVPQRCHVAGQHVVEVLKLPDQVAKASVHLIPEGGAPLLLQPEVLWLLVHVQPLRHHVRLSVPVHRLELCGRRRRELALHLRRRIVLVGKGFVPGKLDRRPRNQLARHSGRARAGAAYLSIF
mmetsp:Transcript_24781/g.62305  ORF Transcript_24781/g.62305 Transcript_24781/m.62305 type:complete len:564 (-) Transcript_24781:1081-2772(-)